VNKLSPATRRIVALALLIAAVALPWRLLVLPLLERFDAYEEQVATQQDLLVRYRGLADSREQFQQRLQQLQAEPASQEGYLSGESATLVAAELQNLVRTTVERSGGRLESTQILPAAPEGEFQRVTLRVRMSADTDGLFRVLYDLESMLPYLFVESVDIVSRERRTTRRAQDGPEEGVLNVSYDVYGYMRAG
jgi:general secretion pathway protein M